MKHCNNHKQHRRSGKILSLAACLLAFFCSVTAGAQSVKIHQLGLGDGDCALIEIIDYKPNTLVPTLDTAVILIDAQRDRGYAAWEITNFIETRLGPKGLNRKVVDYVILSHVHIDHYGNMTDVLDDLLKDGYEVSYVFDRLAFNVSTINWNLNDVDECYDEVTTGKLSGSAQAYHQFIQDNFDGYNFPISSGMELLENRFINARMLCVAAYGATLSPKTGKDTFFIPWNGYAYKPKSENDLSFAFLLSYGGFRYFTGGDLGGQDHSGYANGEVPVAKYLVSKAGTNFHFCAFKVSHHGSSESTAPAFLSLVKPTLAIIPASLRHYGRSVKPLPTCATLDNLAAANVAKLAFTFTPKGNLGTLANYCKYKNLKNTQDVTLSVNFADLKDTIGMHLSFQPRNGDYDPDGPPTTEDFKCTKVHAKGPFSATALVQTQVMMQRMDTATVNVVDSFYLQGHPDLPPRMLQLPAPRMRQTQELETAGERPVKKEPAAKNRKKKKQHNH